MARKFLFFFIFGLLGLGGLQQVGAQLSVNTASREETRIFYQAIYPASENIVSGWNGNVATGNEGATTAAFRAAMYLRLNYFRAMAGIPANIVDDANFTAGAQKAALMMSANKTLTHLPPLTWLFYSVLGASGAYHSNLTLDFGLRAIDNYMEDPMANNTAAPHRRWLLYPQSTKMGIGDILAAGAYPAANAIWVIDETTLGLVRPATRQSFVSWPPAGYVPYKFIYPRWSFAIAGANFAAASVQLQRNGASVPVRSEVLTPDFGENTLVFVPDNLDPNNWAGPVAPAGDITTTVTINNVLIGGRATSFTYNVTAFDPAQNGADTVPPNISGPPNPVIGTATTYSVNALPLATGYQWQTSQSSAYTAIDGAETGGSVLPQIAAGYNFRDSTVKAAGSFSYHLAQPTFQPVWFTLAPSLVPDGGGVLNFKSRLGYASTTQVAKVQISSDGGNLWETVWSQAGNGGAGQLAFVDRSLSLAAYAGRSIQVRFYFDWSSGTIYPQTTEGIGWYIDNISFSGAQIVSATSLSSVAADGNFTFTPTLAGTYNLQVRPQVYGQYYLAWSPVRSVVATADGNPPPPPPPAVAAPNLQLTGSLAFGSRKLKSKTIRVLTLKNTGTAPLIVSKLVYPVGFTGKWAGTLAPGAAKKVNVTFQPTAKKAYKGNVSVKSNATAGSSTLAVSGKGI